MLPWQKAPVPIEPEASALELAAPMILSIVTFWVIPAMFYFMTASEGTKEGKRTSAKEAVQTAESSSLAVRTTPSTAEVMAFGTSDEGEPKTLEFRRFLTQSDVSVSSWHDVPLHTASGNLRAVIEIPRMTTAKMEMATKEAHAPIKQDTKKGKLRTLVSGRTHGQQCVL